MYKVFFVEDEPIVRKAIRESISWNEEGYDFCGESGDGETALPLILKIKPDILITDIKMPFMDGLELSRLVKKEAAQHRYHHYEWT
ncbi:MAG: response regulator [Flexilinea sp.]